MAYEETIEAGPSSSTQTEVRITIPELPDSEAVLGLRKIRELIVDPVTPVTEILKLISLQIVDVLLLMSQDQFQRKGATSMGDLDKRLKGLQALQKTLADAEATNRKDNLNFDGPKFHFASS
jgi:hypothetical protein